MSIPLTVADKQIFLGQLLLGPVKYAIPMIEYRSMAWFADEQTGLGNTYLTFKSDTARTEMCPTHHLTQYAMAPETRESWETDAIMLGGVGKTTDSEFNCGRCLNTNALISCNGEIFADTNYYVCVDPMMLADDFPHPHTAVERLVVQQFEELYADDLDSDDDEPPHTFRRRIVWPACLPRANDGSLVPITLVAHGQFIPDAQANLRQSVSTYVATFTLLFDYFRALQAYEDREWNAWNAITEVMRCHLATLCTCPVYFDGKILTTQDVIDFGKTTNDGRNPVHVSVRFWLDIYFKRVGKMENLPAIVNINAIKAHVEQRLLPFLREGNETAESMKLDAQKVEAMHLRLNAGKLTRHKNVCSEVGKPLPGNAAMPHIPAIHGNLGHCYATNINRADT